MADAPTVQRSQEPTVRGPAPRAAQTDVQAVESYGDDDTSSLHVPDPVQLVEHVLQLVAGEAAALLGVDVAIRPDELSTDQGHIGEGYGIATPGGREAIRLLAERDGVLLDPTYTAKAMAALIAEVRAGGVPPDDTVVFLHTGGAPALFAHAGLFD